MHASQFRRRHPVYADKGLNAAEWQAVPDLLSEPTSRGIFGMNAMRVVDRLVAKPSERPTSERSQYQLRLGKGDRSIAWVQRIDFGLREADALDVAYQAQGTGGARWWPDLIDRILPPLRS
jgi:hypothetical protein